MLRARLHEQEIRRILGVPGAGDLELAGIGTPASPEDCCVYWLDDSAAARAAESLAGVRDCIVLAPAGSRLGEALPGLRVLEVSDPRAAIAAVLDLIRALDRQEPLVRTGRIAPGASLSPTAVVEGNIDVADDVRIESGCAIGPDVVIGSASVLRSGARVGPRVVIGERCEIGPNAVIGAPGFGYIRTDGEKVRMPHLAGVVIGSDVDIGACAVVESGAIAPTVIEDHAKVGDCAAVGHGARIGRGASLCGSNVIGGNAAVGEDAWLGMNSTLRNGYRVGARALIGMDASIQEDVPDDHVARAPAALVAPRRDDDRGGIGFRRRGG